MADNVDITAGAGTSIATDDVGGAHFQRVKPDLGGNGVSVPPSVGAGAVDTGTQRTTLASDDPAVAAIEATSTATADVKTATEAAADVLGVQTGAAIVTDANGTIQRYLRGLVKFFADALGAGTAAAAHRVTLASDDPGVAALGAPAGAAVITDANGTIQQYLRGIVKLAITAGGWLVNISQVAGQNAISGGVNGSLAVGGNVAHDGVNAGNPMLGGAEAIAHGANPAAVAAADRTKLYASRAGIPFVHNGHPNIKTAVYITTGAQTDDALLAAIAGGTKYVIVGYAVRLDEAVTAGGISVLLGFGTSTLPALGSSGADGVDDLIDYHPGLVPGSGFGDTDCYIPGGDGAEPRITCEAPTGGTLAVRLRYFTIES